MKVFYFVEYRMERLVNVKNLVKYINRIKEMTKSCEVTVNICRFMQNNVVKGHYGGSTTMY